MVSIFSFVCYPSICLLWRNVCLILWPTFWLHHLFFWSWAACIFLRLILCQLLRLLYFLPFWRLSFHLAYSFFHCAKLLSLIRSHLFIFAFISITLGGGSKSILLWFMSESVLPIRSFIVSGLTFRSLIHFEFIFVYGVSSFILLQVVDQFSQHHLLKRLSFLHCIFLPPLSKIGCP